MSDGYETETPTTDAMIAGVMKQFPMATKSGGYYQEVHQHIAPLARTFETLLRECADKVTSGDLRARILRTLEERKAPLA